MHRRRLLVGETTPGRRTPYDPVRLGWGGTRGRLWLRDGPLSDQSLEDARGEGRVQDAVWRQTFRQIEE